MPRLAARRTVQRRSKDKRTFIFSINESSGLPPEICQQWQRRGFTCLPAELAAYREPKSKSIAENGVDAFIEFLKKEVSQGTIYKHYGPVLVRDWLVRFTSLDNNPRAERLISEGTPYSPDMLALYKTYYDRYIDGDPFLDIDINIVDVPSARAFCARIGMKKTKDERVLAGTRAYVLTVGFVRMAFHEYWKDHQDWKNPFDRIDPPKRITSRPRDVLQEDEILKLFMPDVITDPLERAVATAMFWAGLRRSEIFALNTMIWSGEGTENCESLRHGKGSARKRNGLWAALKATNLARLRSAKNYKRR